MWMHCEDIVLREINKTQSKLGFTIPFTFSYYRSQVHRERIQSGGSQHEKLVFNRYEVSV